MLVYQRVSWFLSPITRGYGRHDISIVMEDISIIQSIIPINIEYMDIYGR